MKVLTRGHESPRPGVLRFWIALAIVYGAVAACFASLSIPSPYLFAGVVAGAACTMRLPDPQPFPRRVRQVGLAVIGVAAGSAIDTDVLRTILDQPVAILLAIAATFVATLASGQVLRLSAHISLPTAVLASVAGGAAGVAAVARELDADETMVLTIQYLRVLFVLATVPIVAPLLGATGTSAAGEAAGPAWTGAWFTVVAVMMGLALSLMLRFSASQLVLPLLAATALSLAEVFPSAHVPTAVLAFGYATTGLQVGLSLTPAALRQIGRVMPLALLQVAFSMAGCAAVGLGFSHVAGVSSLDGYLATTPGGLPAVIAVAIGSGANVGLVMTMQLVRIFVGLLLAPVLGVAFRRHSRDAERDSL
jgi:uncharacterized protein